MFSTPSGLFTRISIYTYVCVVSRLRYKQFPRCDGCAHMGCIQSYILYFNVLMWSLVQYVRTDHCCINSYRGLQRSSSTNFSRDAPAQTYTANLQHRHLLRCSAQTSTEILSTDIYRGPSAQTCTEVFRVMSHCMAADVTAILSTESCRTPTEERFAHVWCGRSSDTLSSFFFRATKYPPRYRGMTLKLDMPNV